MDNHNKLKILQWNINSIKSRHADLAALLQAEQHDIIMIQETLLKAKDRHFLRINDFTLYTSDATNDRQDPKLLRNRGLLTAVANHITSKRIKQVNFGTCIDSLSVEIILPGKVISLHNIYVHLNNPDFNLNLDPLEGNFIMGGDFNAHHESWGGKRSNHYGNHLRELIDNNANAILLNDTYKQATTIQGSAIDLTIASPALANRLDWEVLDCVSDIHFAINISYTTPAYIKKEDFIPRLKIDETNWEKYQEAHNSFFNEIDPESHNDMDELLSIIIKGFQGAIDVSVPMTKYSPTPWKCWFWNTECAKARESVNYWVKQKRRGVRDINDKLEKVQQLAKETYVKAQNSKWQEICESISFDKDCSKAWKRIKNIYNGGATYKPKAVPNPQEKADELMSEFAGRTATSNLPQEVIDTLEKLKPNRLKVIQEAIDVEMESCQPFTIEEMNEACSTTKKSAPGTDSLTYTLINKAPQVTRAALLALCNLSYSHQRLPSDWKEAGLIAIPKQGSNSFRPITLLSCLDKIMEKMIARRLKHELHDFEEGIVGFVPGRGTADGLAILSALTSSANPPKAPLYDPAIDRPPVPAKPTSNEARENREQFSRKNNVKNLRNKPKLTDNSRNKKYKSKAVKSRSRSHQIHVIHIDFEKAFELVRSEVILEAASEMGIKGNLLAWIKDYLADRKGHVNFQNHKSETAAFENGTPQGSVISPILFNLVMNKLVRKEDYPKSCLLVSYADDVYIINRYPRQKMSEFLKALRIFERKCRELGLKVSIDKTKAMCYGKVPRLQPLPTYYLNGEPITWVNEFKYLGVMYDKKLNFVSHVAYLRNKLRPKINLLKSMAGAQWGTSTKTLKRYYLSNIRSVLEYGSQAMLTASEKARNDIEVIQNICLRIILHAPPGTPTEVLQAEAGILPINSRRDIQAIKLLAKIAANPLSHPITSIIEQDLQKNLRWVFPFATWAMSAAQIMKDYDFKLPSKRDSDTKIKPWGDQPTRATLHINPEFQGKNNMSNIEKNRLAAKIHDMLLSQENHFTTTFYTDGSVSGEGVASYGVYMRETQDDGTVTESDLTAKLVNKHGSMIAELAAIKHALELALAKDDTRCVHIITDSLSAMHAMQRTNPLDNRNLINKINEYVKNLEDSGRFVSVTWIPSHIGVPGNEIADELASEGQLKDPTITIPCSDSSNLTDLYYRVKEKWKHSVRMSPKAGVKRYLRIEPSLKTVNIPLSNRYDEALMARLRLSAGTRCTFYCPTFCARCDEDFSVSHYLVNCPATPIFCCNNKQVLTEEELDLDDVDAFAAIIIQIASYDPQPLIDRVNLNPIDAYCNKGHPTWKQYGRCRRM